MSTGTWFRPNRGQPPLAELGMVPINAPRRPSWGSLIQQREAFTGQLLERSEASCIRTDIRRHHLRGVSITLPGCPAERLEACRVERPNDQIGQVAYVRRSN